MYISLEETIKEQEKGDLLVKKNKKKGGEAFLFLLETNIFRNITNSITYVYFQGGENSGKGMLSINSMAMKKYFIHLYFFF